MTTTSDNHAIARIDGSGRVHAVTHDRDFGTVERDARGDFRLTSPFIAPPQQTATAVGGGIQLHLRVPGYGELFDPLCVRG